MSLTLTDMFCGAGGSSIGATEVPGIDLRMGLNHWSRAIETHATNFPEAGHDCTDVSATNPRRYPRTDILIASPECTNHSLAKGAQRKGLSQYDAFQAITDDPAAERSRATMFDVCRFAEVHQYKIIIVENVVDARSWVMWDAWLLAMTLLGYDHRCVYLNSMFAHPTPQSRDRMYVVFWRRGNRAPDLDIYRTGFCLACERNVEAVQSWKNGRTAGRYLRQYLYCCPKCASPVTPYYYCALNAIDLSIPAERIGDRKKPLRERTLERVRWGLEKFGRTPLCITTRYTSGVECRARDMAAEPMPTQPGDPSHALVSPFLVETLYTHAGERRAYPVDAPAPTQSTKQSIGVAFLIEPHRLHLPHDRGVQSLTDPLRTQTTRDGQGVVVINGAALMTMRDSGGAGYLMRSLASPLPTQVATCTQDWLIQRQPYLVSYYGTLNGGPVTEAMATQPSKDRHALIQPTQDEPIDVNDCYFRMLKPDEIGVGMAFPASYVVLGNSRERVKQYGNAVTPPAMKLLIERCVASLT